MPLRRQRHSRRSSPRFYLGGGCLYEFSQVIVEDVFGAIAFEAGDINQSGKNAAQVLFEAALIAFDPPRQFTAFPGEFARLFG